MRTKGIHSIYNNPKVIALLEKIKYLIYLDSFFNKDENILGYEGAFNTYLYLKNSICNFIDEKKDVKQNFEVLFGNFSEKQIFVKEHFAEIANFLLDVRNTVFNARVSVYNNGLSRGARKTNTVTTYSQQTFVDAITFECTLEELQEKNYDKVKQLIYVPIDNKKCYKYIKF